MSQDKPVLLILRLQEAQLQLLLPVNLKVEEAEHLMHFQEKVWLLEGPLKKQFLLLQMDKVMQR